MKKKTKAQISYNMSKIRSCGTLIEKNLGKALWAAGLRYRKNYKHVIGKPDFVLVEKKIAIFCDSSFWHGYRNMTTKRHDFKSNKEFWRKKISSNIERDKKVNRLLKEKGWTVIRFWDLQINKDVHACVRKVLKITERVIAIDFFCGCGGATYGMRKAGVRVLAGLDSDPNVRYAYEKNNKGSKFYLADIENKQQTVEVVKNILKNKKWNTLIFLACAPCQPFSFHNKQYKTDKRKSLMSKFVSVVESLPEEMRPSFIIAENVGPMKKRGKEILEKTKSGLKNLDYMILPPKIINAANFSVPQNRKRLIFIAAGEKYLKSESKFNWEYFFEQYKGVPINVRKAIGHLPPVRAKWKTNRRDFLHITQSLNEKNLSRIKKIKIDGGSRDMWDKKDMLKCYEKHDGHKDVYGRMAWDKPAPTLTCRCISISNGRFGHPSQNRAITLREAAILQTMGDYKFEEPVVLTRVARQIGNAVPPNLVKELTSFVIEVSGYYGEG